MYTLKLTQIGSQLAILVPPELRGRYGLKEGDTVYLNGVSDGSTLAPAVAEAPITADPAMVEQLHAGQEFMRDFHAAFRALAR
jgi:bifunctional DNA-binding transcriptional regulator/antitoxin component of YhaV-PrlF toxin-antitoxin module